MEREKVDETTGNMSQRGMFEMPERRDDVAYYLNFFRKRGERLRWLATRLETERVLDRGMNCFADSVILFITAKFLGICRTLILTRFFDYLARILEKSSPPKRLDINPKIRTFSRDLEIKFYRGLVKRSAKFRSCHTRDIQMRSSCETHS